MAEKIMIYFKANTADVGAAKNELRLAFSVSEVGNIYELFITKQKYLNMYGFWL